MSCPRTQEIFTRAPERGMQNGKLMGILDRDTGHEDVRQKRYHAGEAGGRSRRPGRTFQTYVGE